MSDSQEITKATAKSINDIKILKTTKQLDTIQLDLESPRMKEAMSNLGFTKENLKMGASKKPEKEDDDVSKLRYEHFQNRLLTTINKIIAERNRIKMSHYKKLISKIQGENDKK
mmetsp:Transcript_20464/g.20195  ORF Transcript_20464/g.20195 Transcript_20464/m.20195 type:complete len:114 (+) Transcript_20464:15-356(+)